ncbi:ABC transporter substrate-binding protein [Tengunoibacter tsumagoiensis]|uniref:Sulfonate ABC transporter substrate-binding protein n=1 Tax=Tengunoibacter tsumagoiensis TaxID=2014871 RepID=A0A402A0U8_9CHLR|nr:ABC transporter substrate-binding protein [Tengunoibacter tsumagoiensis]GCE12780.1 sulfonate ABC transporter substrate-binding protein [Tengunoibacter tsumagoiensis]
MAKHRWLVVSLSLIALILFVSGCGNSQAASSPSAVPDSFTIAYQPGLGSVSLITIKLQKTLEKQYPKTKIQWKVVNSGSAVREAVIANQAQLGSLGLPPFLVGWDRGFNWKVLTATNRSDGWFVVKDPNIKSLKDLKPTDKIGVVAPDSQQAILIRKAAQQQLGDAHALDKNLVTISSADGEVALRNGQLTAQLSGSPFQEREVAAGDHVIFHTKDIFGPVGAGLLVLPEKFYNQYPDFSKAFYKDYQDAVALNKANHEQAAQFLAQDQGGGGSVANFKALLDSPSFIFDTTPSGLVVYAKFMKSIGLTSKEPGSVKDFELPTVYGTGS